MRHHHDTRADARITLRLFAALALLLAVCTSALADTYRTMYLKCSQGSYLYAENAGGGSVGSSSAYPSAWETFTLIQRSEGELQDGSVVNIRAWNGQCLSAQGGGGGAVIADANVASGWEAYVVVRRKGAGIVGLNDEVGFRTLDGQHYLTADYNHGGRITATAPWFSGWETFTIRVGNADIPHNLGYPLNTRDVRVVLGFGADWLTNGCDGKIKLHSGVDLRPNAYNSAPARFAGQPVSAAADGVVRMVNSESPWGYYVTVAHKDWQGREFTTTYWHLNKPSATTVYIGATVRKGQQLGTVYDLGSNTHSHFSLRNAPYSNDSNRGAQPQTVDCADGKRWPEYNVFPLIFIG